MNEKDKYLRELHEELESMPLPVVQSPSEAFGEKKGPLEDAGGMGVAFVTQNKKEQEGKWAK